MPILRIEVVGEADDYPKGLAQRIADSASLVLDSRPGGTWVSLRFVESSNYAENGGVTEDLPMLVSLLLSEIPDKDVLRSLILNLTRAIALAAEHPKENVHIVIEPAAEGRIAFGGTLVE